jgi:hypothetical protein
MDTYEIVRKFRRDDEPDQVIKTGLTLLEAHEYCTDPETSSRTCTSDECKQLTQEKGEWFDAYYPEE